jgi:hypothetical protein
MRLSSGATREKGRDPVRDRRRAGPDKGNARAVCVLHATGQPHSGNDNGRRLTQEAPALAAAGVRLPRG